MVLTANQCVTKGDLPAWIAGDEEAVGSSIGGTRPTEVNGRAPSPLKLRRRSTTILEDGNEIVLPETPGLSAGPAPEVESGWTKPREKVQSKPDVNEYVSRGGSCIVGPLGDVLSGPLWEEQGGLLVADVDFDDCLRGRLDIDVAGSYSRYARMNFVGFYILTFDRNDAFKLTVEGLDLFPPA